MPSPASYQVSASSLTSSGTGDVEWSYNSPYFSAGLYPSSYGDHGTNLVGGGFSCSLPGGVTVNGIEAGAYAGASGTDPILGGTSTDTWGFTTPQISAANFNASCSLTYSTSNGPGGCTSTVNLSINGAGQSKTLTNSYVTSSSGGTAYVYAIGIVIYYTTPGGATGSASFFLFL